MARAGAGESGVEGLLPGERLRWPQLLRRLGLAAAMVLLPVMAGGFAVALAAKPLRIAPQLPAAVVSTVIAVLAYRNYVRRIERRPVVELARAGMWRELGLGVLLGASLFTVVIAVLAAAGAYRVVGQGAIAGALGALVASVAAAVVEEIVFRGIVFRLVESAVGSSVAIVVSAAIFGALHALSPHPTALGLVAITLEAGVLLACAYVLTRRLWFAIGLHAAWNFMQGGVFGAAVSGTPSKGLLVGTLRGPEWLTGGAFGPEASLISIVVCLAAATALLARARRLGRVVASPRGG